MSQREIKKKSFHRKDRIRCSYQFEHYKITTRLYNESKDIIETKICGIFSPSKTNANTNRNFLMVMQAQPAICFYAP